MVIRLSLALALTLSVSSLSSPARAQGWDDINAPPPPQAQPAPQPAATPLMPTNLPASQAWLKLNQGRIGITSQQAASGGQGGATQWPSCFYQAPVEQKPLPPGAQVPGAPTYTTRDNTFSLTKGESFFGGITEADLQKAATVKIDPIVDPAKQSPEWVKAKPTSQFVDETEHFGREGQMGFF